MLDYRLYFMDDAGHIRAVVEFDCANDADAAVLAAAYADGRPMELWRRDRWICRFSGQDRLSGVNSPELPR